MTSTRHAQPPKGRRLQERLQQLIWIDVNGSNDIFRQRKLIQGLAHERG